MKEAIDFLFIFTKCGEFCENKLQQLFFFSFFLVVGAEKGAIILIFVLDSTGSFCPALMTAVCVHEI